MVTSTYRLLHSRRSRLAAKRRPSLSMGLASVVLSSLWKLWRQQKLGRRRQKAQVLFLAGELERMDAIVHRVEASRKALAKELAAAREEAALQVERTVGRVLEEGSAARSAEIDRAVRQAVASCRQEEGGAEARESVAQEDAARETAALRKQLEDVTSRLVQIESRTATSYPPIDRPIQESPANVRRQVDSSCAPSTPYGASPDPFSFETQPLLAAGSAPSAELPPAALGSPLERALSNPFTFSLQDEQGLDGGEGNGPSSHAVIMDTQSAYSWDLMDLGTPEPARPPGRSLESFGIPTHTRQPSRQGSAPQAVDSSMREGGMRSLPGTKVAPRSNSFGMPAAELGLPDVPPTPFEDLLSLDPYLQPPQAPTLPEVAAPAENGSIRQLQAAPADQPLQSMYRGTSVHLHRRRGLLMKQANRHKLLCQQEESREQFNSAALEALSRAGEHLRKTELLMREAEETDEAAERIVAQEANSGQEKSEACRGAEFRAVKAKSACESSYSKLCLLLDTAARVAGPPDPGQIPQTGPPRKNSGGTSFSIKNLWKMGEARSGEGIPEGGGVEPSPGSNSAKQYRPATKPTGNHRAPMAPNPHGRPSHNRSHSNVPLAPPGPVGLDRRSAGSSGAHAGPPVRAGATGVASPHPSGHRRSRSSTDIATFDPSSDGRHPDKKQEESLDDIIFELERRRLAL